MFPFSYGKTGPITLPGLAEHQKFQITESEIRKQAQSFQLKGEI